jgi:hypothetical protein
MNARCHPIFDNPVRMGYVAGWHSIDDLVQRLSDLALAVGESRVVPAAWEPYYRECPSCRWAGAYTWAQRQLQNPAAFAQALALFPGEQEKLSTPIGHAIWLILSTKMESSHITRKLMLTDAFETWERHAGPWLESVVETCAALGVATSTELLQQHVRQALLPLAKDVPPDDDEPKLLGSPAAYQGSHGFDKELLHLDGWTQDPGLIILPVDGPMHALTRQILRLDLHKVVLLRAGKSARSVAWENVTLVHLFEGAVTFEVLDELPLTVAGYKHPEQILAIVEECYKAAIERILQALAAKVIHTAP